MKKEDLGMLKISEIKVNSQYMIKNLIASNNDKDPVGQFFSFGHPFSFDGIVFAFCIKGEAKAKIDFKEYKIEKNSIITILPGHIIEILEQPEDFFIEVLAFADVFVTDMPLPTLTDMRIPQKIILNPVLNVHDVDVQNLLHYHSFIIDVFETRKESPFLEEMIKGLLYSLILEIVALYHENSTLYSKKKNNRSEELVERFFILLFEHYKSERSASFYAGKICVTPKHLSSALKIVTGQTINSWIKTATTMGAKSLLKSTKLTVLQISEELSFPNPSYFGRFFRQMTGMTPLEYRAS